jgi:hypothetical protein
MSALLRRELEVAAPNEPKVDMGNSLAELIEEYSALRYLGQRATDYAAWSLSKVIHSAIANEMSLEEYQAVWARRVMPSTASFINAMVKKVAKVISGLAQLVKMPEV